MYHRLWGNVEQHSAADRGKPFSRLFELPDWSEASRNVFLPSVLKHDKPGKGLIGVVSIDFSSVETGCHPLTG